MRKIDLEGQQFSRWTVLKDTKVSSAKRTLWECRCICGSKKYVDGVSLTQGNSTSCGCFRTELFKELHKSHGKSKHWLHSRWRGLKDRCLNSKHKNYRLYGGRGITVAPEWIANFEVFFAYVSVLPGYDKSKSIDRIDVNGNYEPGNIRWTITEQQSWNTRQQKGKFKGVSLTSYGAFKAQITHRRKKYYLGVYRTEKEAALAYNKAALEHFGKYAYLNKVS